MGDNQNPHVWVLDDLVKAAMYGAQNADTPAEFAEQTYQGVSVCARRVHDSDTDILAFFDSAQAPPEPQPLADVLKEITKLEQNIKDDARITYYSFTDTDVEQWAKTHRSLQNQSFRG